MSERLPAYMDSPRWGWVKAILSTNGPKSSTMRLVLVVLGEHMNKLGESCFPTLPQLVEQTALGRSTVVRQLRAAADQGWITKHPEYRGGRLCRVVYRPGYPPEVLKVWGAQIETLVRSGHGGARSGPIGVPAAGTKDVHKATKKDTPGPSGLTTPSISPNSAQSPGPTPPPDGHARTPAGPATAREPEPLPVDPLHDAHSPEAGLSAANLAQELLALYPHGAGENGVRRRPRIWVAERNLCRAIAAGATPEDIRAGAELFAARVKTGSRYTPSLANWIEQHGWRDELLGDPAEVLAPQESEEERAARLKKRSAARTSKLVAELKKKHGLD